MQYFALFCKKDFYDIIFIAQNNQFTSQNLNKAITTTFKHRKTNINDKAIIYKNTFTQDKEKQTQWNAFLKRNKLNTDTTFPQIVNKIKEFIEPVLSENNNKTWNPNKWKWK
ncbi:MAG: nucleotidyl transferase AbiEii/AbiGii toxin family protein [Melioribacteraceae bacterium]|nr:nucleotidyl transferase AbiEii/AbiGii toxin family protein [Melioribacteraceae bacterium]